MVPRMARDRSWRGRPPVAVVAIVCACCAMVLAAGPARGQSPRAWAGSTVAKRQGDGERRESVRVAVAPEPTAGEAVADTAIPTGNLLSTIRDGGILMVPLIGCSFLLAAFGFERLVSLRWSRVVPRPFVARFIEQIQAGALSRGEALDACEENGSPAARVFAAAVRRWGRPAVEIEQAALDACEREVNHLRRYRRVFNGIAMSAPCSGCWAPCSG
ncbi:MAG: MotA/TolQ/ExbB proton channel family protein [Planctomycetia bacterium]